MPPRKRKAAPKLLAIVEDADGHDELGPSTSQPTAVEGAASVEAEIATVIARATDEVNDKAKGLMMLGRARSQALRDQGDCQILTLTSKVRKMTLAELFKMSTEEAAASSIMDVHSLLDAVQLLEEATGAGAAAAAVGAASRAGPADLTSKASTSAAAAAGGAGAPKSPLRGATAMTAVKQPLAPSTAANTMSTRLPGAGEVVYSANGSPIFLPHSFGVAAKGTGSLADATPAFGMSAALPHQPAAGGLVMTGHTFRRATAARGRTKQATRAITVTVADGRQFVVDDVLGLANVPEKYHVEVAGLVEQDMQDLSALAATVLKGAAPSTVISSRRPLRSAAVGGK